MNPHSLNPAPPDEGICDPRDLLRQDRALRDLIDQQLKAAGDWKYTRYPRPDCPPFKQAPSAARRLLDDCEHRGIRRLLVLRDQCLREVREECLRRNLTLVVPAKDGSCACRIPRQAFLDDRTGTPITPALRIDPFPTGSQPYRGPVDVVVVGCAAFNPCRRRVCILDCDRTAYVVEQLQEDGGIELTGALRMTVASDAQQLDDWPRWTDLNVVVDWIFTPTRGIKTGRPAVRQDTPGARTEGGSCP